ncbi:MAG: hypothetical protein ACLTNY_09880 [Blautia massiliensis (ex Durand et al. 2017)]
MEESKRHTPTDTILFYSTFFFTFLQEKIVEKPTVPRKKHRSGAEKILRRLGVKRKEEYG